MHNIKIASLALAASLVAANPTYNSGGRNNNNGWNNNNNDDDCDETTSTKKMISTTPIKAATTSSTCKPTTISLTSTTTCTETKTITKPAAYQTVTLTDYRVVTQPPVTQPPVTITVVSTKGQAVPPPVTINNTITVSQTVSQPFTITKVQSQTETFSALTTITETLSECTSLPSTRVNPVSTTSTRSATTSAKLPCVTIPGNGTFCNPKDPCAPQPEGSGPVPSPDTPEAFKSLAAFSDLASQAPESLSSHSTGGTKYAKVFSNLQASVSTKNYLGLQTLGSYDVAACAALCDSTDTCLGFNIFAERDPSLKPTTWGFDAPASWGEDCPNPASTTNFQCTIWGCTFDASVATNEGGWREQFNIAVAGSVGYNLK